MARAEIELKVSEEIASGQSVADTRIVPNGKDIKVVRFKGEGAFTANSVVCLVWDYGGAGEEILWSTKGADDTDLYIIRQGDGVKKLAVVCDNGEAGPVVMTGWCQAMEQV